MRDTFSTEKDPGKNLKNIRSEEKRLTLKDTLLPLHEQEMNRYTLTEYLWEYLFHYALKHQRKAEATTRV